MNRFAKAEGQVMMLGSPFMQAESNGVIPERFARVVQAYPDRLAVKTRTAQVTYCELDQLSNGIANMLLSECGLAPTPIGLLADRGVLPLALMLGVL